MSPDLSILIDLASETDLFYEFEDVEILQNIQPDWNDLDDDEIDAILEDHSQSVFENAAAIYTLNEQAPGTFVTSKLGRLEVLAGDDFTIDSIVETLESSRLVGHVTLTDGNSAPFNIEYRKRADITPLFTTMNALISPLEIGIYTIVDTGRDDDLIAIYLRPREQEQYRQWAARQHYDRGVPLEAPAIRST